MKNETSPKKVSEIFVRYVEPLLDEMPKDVAPDQMKKIFTFPIAIWNATAISGWGNEKNYIDEILKEVQKNGSPEIKSVAGPLVRFWVDRKKDLFPNESWGIEDVISYRDFNEELIIRVIARAPEQFKHQLPNPIKTFKYASILN